MSEPALAPLDTSAPLGAGLDFTDPNSPLAPYYLRASHVVAAAVLGLVFLIITHVPLWHTDVWGHVGMGRWIATNLSLPATDPQCPYSEPGAPTIHYSWLGQTSLYLAYHIGELLAGGDAAQQAAGGAEMLRFSHALVVALRCLLLLLAFRRLGVSPAAACVGLIASLAAGLGNIAILRPQVLGELFFAATLLTLSRPQLSRRAVALLPALLALWANVHASFAVGLLLLGGVLIGKAIEAAAGGKSVFADTGLRRLALALLLSTVLVSVANPWGPRVFLNLFAMSSHPVVRAMDEWQPLSFDLGPGGHWAFLATLLVGAVGLLLRGKAPSPTAIILTLLFASQPLLHQRALIWWLMLAPWLALPWWASTLDRSLTLPSVPSFRKTLLTGALALLALSWSTPGRWLLAGKPAPIAGLLSDGTPRQLARTLKDPAAADGLPALAEQLRRSYPEGRYAGEIFATETLGDYLLWEIPASEHPVFAYSHVHLFSREHWQEVATVRGANDGWEKVLQGHHINLVVAEAEQNQRLCELLSKNAGWKVVLDETGLTSKRDKRCRLFVAVRVKPI